VATTAGRAASSMRTEVVVPASLLAATLVLSPTLAPAPAVEVFSEALPAASVARMVAMWDENRCMPLFRSSRMPRRELT
jgi:hypothetical protein